MEFLRKKNSHEEMGTENAGWKGVAFEGVISECAGADNTSISFLSRLPLRCAMLALFAVLLVFAPSLKADAAWKTTTAGKMYTISESPGYATGLVTIGSYKYYFNDSGIMQTGFVTIKKSCIILIKTAGCNTVGLPLAAKNITQIRRRAFSMCPNG
ncbi:MAG: hypothetical protein LUF35_01485 [Lachnospiraceae bacterium]|nr:hypothetical protein [Lachnospiraceae bacterium]